MIFDGNERPVPSAPGYRFRAFASVGSTNASALEAARAGDPGRLWFVAGEQTAGRARRGRHWTSERGNLYASVLLVDVGPADRLGELPLVAAVALADAVEAACGTIGLVRLKWPNDLLIEGRKISGILLEAQPLADDRTAVVCGFGVNCRHHPDLGHYPAGDLAAFGYNVQADRLFALLAQSLQSTLDDWVREGGFAAIRDRWVARASGIGEKITVRYPDRELTGIFLGIEPDGRLRLLVGGKTVELISAGDVFFAM